VQGHRLGLTALVLVTVVWGTTFPAMKAMSGDLHALEIIALRFAVAMVVLTPFLWRSRWQEWRWGLLMGGVMFVATALQVQGLSLTTSNRNAFLTGLNVLIVPMLAAVLGPRLGWPVLAGGAPGGLGLVRPVFGAAAREGGSPPHAAARVFSALLWPLVALLGGALLLAGGWGLRRRLGHS